MLSDILGKSIAAFFLVIWFTAAAVVPMAVIAVCYRLIRWGVGA